METIEVIGLIGWVFAMVALVRGSALRRRVEVLEEKMNELDPQNPAK